MFDLQLWHFILTASLSKLEQWPPEKTKFDYNIFGALFLSLCEKVQIYEQVKIGLQFFDMWYL